MVAEAEANYAQVRRILQSKAFRTSEVHRNLLNYLSEKSLSGTADNLKEYTVGLDVFAKPDSYDPRQESVVRMHTARLRQKLAEYYRTEGAEDAIFVDLPKGGFKVTFEPRAEPEPLAPAPVFAQIPRPTYRREMILAALLVVAIACASYFGLRLRQVQRTGRDTLQEPTAWTPELRELWAPLLSMDRPLVVCLQTQGGSDASPAHSLTGLATANGAFVLGQFLADRKQNVFLTGSEALSLPEISMGNVVFLGPAPENRQLQALAVDQQFVVEPQGIRNLHPQAGEPTLIADQASRNSKSADQSYALITHAPGLSGKGDVLYFSGNHVSSVTAGVEAFTDPALAKTLVTKMRKPDGSLPRFYQVVLKVKSMDDMPLEISYVMHRELSGKAVR
jgi:hypothetical protein